MPETTATTPPTEDRERCTWATGEWMIPYHDEEWGVAVHDDRTHFEYLILEGAQAGLSWLTILKRREGYRRIFADFDPERVVRFTPVALEQALLDPGIIRNRLKVESTVINARAFLDVQAAFGSFDDYLWGFVDGVPIVNHWTVETGLPATTALSDAVSADLKKRGFKFVGSTVCYAHLQAAGLVVDHLTSCFRHPEHPGT